MGIPRPYVHKWSPRYLELGPDGIHDCSSRPRTAPTKIRRHVEARIVLGRLDKAGPQGIGLRLGLPPASMCFVVVRHDPSRLTGPPARMLFGIN